MREGPISRSGSGPSASGREVLPTSIKPTHYDLSIEPDLEEAISFDGSVAISLDVLEDTSSISLNAGQLEISETKVVAEDGESIRVSGISFDEGKEVLKVELKRELAEGEKVTLKLNFRGSHLHQSTGFYRSPVEGENGNWMVSTFMEPTDARKVFPCFDEPALKATFTVTLIADERYTCLGNMDVSSSASIISHQKPKKAVTFNKTPKMSTYIVCFAVGVFNSIETNKFRVPVRVFAPKDKNIEQGKFALDLAARTLEAFEKIFDIDFPLPKMDLIAVPAGQGAMENWGLVTFDESALLVDDNETSAKARRSVGSVIVHELAHQWFGNIVTMDFWDGLWLNEAFASWAECYSWETLDPSWLMWQRYTTQGLQKGLELDSNRASHPIEVPVKRPSEIKQVFDDITYLKGCAVIRMISSFLGIELFVKGIQVYLKEHAFGNANTNDLWESLSYVSGTNVGAVMETWTKNAGYPVVFVKEDEKSGTITVTQHRFFQNGSSDSEDDQLLYPLSLGLKTKHGIKEEKLYTRTRTIKAPLDFYKLNAGHNGFYRVSYSPERLKILGQNAKDGLLSAEDKIGLLSDALAIASSGYSTARTSDVLSLLETFENESSYFVWEQIFNTITAVERAFMFEDSQLLDSLKIFKSCLMNKSLKRKGWNFKKSDDGLEQMFKAIMFEHGTEYSKVRKAAKDMFEAYAAGDSNAININIRRAVFAIVLEQGGSKEYDVILEGSRKASSLDQRNVCLQALGHSRNPTLIQRTLTFAISPEIVARNDVAKVLSSLGQHRPGTEAAWSWMKSNWDEISKNISGGIAPAWGLLRPIMGSFSRREQYNDVRRFFEEKDTSAYDQFLAQSLNTILARANWVERDREDVQRWFFDNGYTEDKQNR